MKQDSLRVIALARLILAHWVEGQPVDQKKIVLAATLNKARLNVVPLDDKARLLMGGVTVHEEDVAPHWDDAINLAKFTAFTCDLEIPKQVEKITVRTGTSVPAHRYVGGKQ